jgi:hypothetical protein
MRAAGRVAIGICTAGSSESGCAGDGAVRLVVQQGPAQA